MWTLKDFKDPKNEVFILFVGDFNQILPVVLNDNIGDEINAFLKSSNLWFYVKSLKLKTNKRVKLAINNNAKKFSRTLL